MPKELPGPVPMPQPLAGRDGPRPVLKSNSLARMDELQLFLKQCDDKQATQRYYKVGRGLGVLRMWWMRRAAAPPPLPTCFSCTPAPPDSRSFAPSPLPRLRRSCPRAPAMPSPTLLGS